MTPLLLYSFFPAHVPRALTYSSCFLPYFRSHEAKPRSFNKDQRWRPVPSFIICNTISTRQREMPCVCVCVSYKCGKTGEVLEETWAAKKSEGQDMRAEGGIKRRVGCRMVARVTVRVATPYVNPPIWSILQSKRIGFLWRWISSAGKLFLPLSLSAPLPALPLALTFFPRLIVIPCVISQLTGFLSSPCLLSLTMMVFIRPHQDRHDPLWYFPNANLSLTPKRL